MSSFFDGLAMVEVKGKFGYIDHSGAFVIKPQFLDGLTFSDGMARVVAEGPCMYFPDGACGSANPRYVGAKPYADVPPCKFTFIDKTGRIITKERFDKARDFSEGLAPVRIGKLWGFIDKNASMVIAPQFNDARPFSSGLSLIRKNGRYGYADKTGSIKIAPQYQYLEDFSEGFASVGDDPYYSWYIGTQGNRAIPGEFDLASPFFKGLAHVRLLPPDAAKMRATFAYIDTKGSVVFKY